LHAQSLTMELNGKQHTFTAPYPDDFRAALAAFESFDKLRTKRLKR